MEHGSDHLREVLLKFSNRDIHTRAMALAEFLALKHEDSIEILQRLYQREPNPSLKQEIAKSIRKLHETRSNPDEKLFEALLSKDMKVQYNAFKTALEKGKLELLPRMYQIQERANDPVLSICTIRLMLFDSERYLSRILSFVSHENEQIRMALCEILSGLAHPQALACLFLLCTDSSVLVAKKACEIFHQIPQPMQEKIWTAVSKSKNSLYREKLLFYLEKQKLNEKIEFFFQSETDEKIISHVQSLIHQSNPQKNNLPLNEKIQNFLQKNPDAKDLFPFLKKHLDKQNIPLEFEEKIKILTLLRPLSFSDEEKIRILIIDFLDSIPSNQIPSNFHHFLEDKNIEIRLRATKKFCVKNEISSDLEKILQKNLLDFSQKKGVRFQLESIQILTNLSLEKNRESIEFLLQSQHLEVQTKLTQFLESNKENPLAQFFLTQKSIADPRICDLVKPEISAFLPENEITEKDKKSDIKKKPEGEITKNLFKNKKSTTISPKKTDFFRFFKEQKEEFVFFFVYTGLIIFLLLSLPKPAQKLQPLNIETIVNAYRNLLVLTPG